MKILKVLTSIILIINSVLPNLIIFNKPKIESVIVDKAIIRVETNIDQGQYCFQYPNTIPKEKSHDWIDFNTNKFQVYKYDGEYDLYIRDKNKNISNPYKVKVNSGYIYTFDGNEMNIVKEKLSDYLKKKNTSIDELNNYIAKEVINAGLYSREAVALAGISIISFLAEYKIAIPYMASGGYGGTKSWGANPNWGKKLLKPVNNGTGIDEYTGMACVGACRWVFQQAGLNINQNYGISNTWDIGRFGEVKKYRDNLLDYRNAKTGDVAKINSHYRIIIDRIDTNHDGECESYLSIEMHKPKPYGYLTCRILPMNTMTSRDDSRAILSMEAIYNNTSRFKKDFVDWKETVIPFDDLPDYIKNRYIIEQIKINIKEIFRGY